MLVDFRVDSLRQSAQHGTELPGRTEPFCLVPNRLYDTDHYFNHRPIVVYDGDQWNFDVLTFFPKLAASRVLFLQNS